MVLPCIVAVPARLESSRLPNKVVADIGGKPMLQRVLERCGQATAPAAVLLCTDSTDLATLATSWGFDAILTSPACESGSERIASVADQLMARGSSREPNHTLIINVQGDQPFIDPAAMFDSIAAEFNRRSPVLIQSLCQGFLPGLTAWVEVGGIAPFRSIRAGKKALKHDITTLLAMAERSSSPTQVETLNKPWDRWEWVTNKRLRIKALVKSEWNQNRHSIGNHQYIQSSFFPAQLPQPRFPRLPIGQSHPESSHYLGLPEIKFHSNLTDTSQSKVMSAKRFLKKVIVLGLQRLGLIELFFSPTSQTLARMGRAGCVELLKTEMHYRRLIENAQDASERAKLYTDINREIKRIKSKYCPEVRTFGYDDSLIRRYSYLFEGKRVLDYGCGYGHSSIALAGLSRHVTGIDASQDCIDNAKLESSRKNIANLEFRAQSELKTSYKDHAFEVCYSNDFLEHLHITDAIEHLKEIKRILTSNGSYLCWTPGAQTGPHDITKAFYPQGVGFKSLGSHIHEYTRSELLQLAEQAGLSVVFPEKQADILAIFKTND